MEDKDSDDFDNWVDKLYGFIHLVNHTASAPRSTTLQRIFVLEVLTHQSEDPPMCATEPKLTYHMISQNMSTAQADKKLKPVHEWLTFRSRPNGVTNREYESLTKYAEQLFVDDGSMWHRNTQGTHKQILHQNRRIKAIHTMYDDTRHCGYYAMHALVTECYWWLFLRHDIVWYVHTCHICQTRQMHQISIRPVVATPVPLFAKMYMDTMHLSCSAGFTFIVQGQCFLTNYPEFHALRKEIAQAIGDWIFQDILC